MVNWNAVKLTAVVVGGLLAFLLVGAALRFAARILSFALLAMLVAAAGYAVYQLYDGWTTAEADELEEPVAGGEDENGAAVDDVRERYVRGELSETEFERALDEVLDGTAADSPDSDWEPEPAEERS